MKIGVIGSGFVGATSAYAMVMRGVGREIVLVDLNKARAQAEADDILHAVPFAGQLDVRAGDYPDLDGCSVVVVTAGVSQRPGENRSELLGRNAKIFNQIIPQILYHAKDAVLVIASNPVDIMTHLTTQIAVEAGLPPTQVLGTGTTLDTARFRALLSRYLGVDSRHVHAYVIGEHGDSEVLTWSLITIGGIPLDEFCEQRGLTICQSERNNIEEMVRKAAYHIIDGKGATYYGIGSAIARIVEMVLRDRRAILTVSTTMAEVAGIKNVTLALPHLIGGEGAMDTLMPPISVSELEALRASTLQIREAIETLEKVS